MSDEQRTKESEVFDQELSLDDLDAQLVVGLMILPIIIATI